MSEWIHMASHLLAARRREAVEENLFLGWKCIWCVCVCVCVCVREERERRPSNGHIAACNPWSPQQIYSAIAALLSLVPLMDAQYKAL